MLSLKLWLTSKSRAPLIPLTLRISCHSRRQFSESRGGVSSTWSPQRFSRERFSRELLRFSYSTLELHLYVKRLRSVGRLVQQQHRVALDRVGFVAVGMHHARRDDRNGVLREAVRQEHVGKRRFTFRLEVHLSERMDVWTPTTSAREGAVNAHLLGGTEVTSRKPCPVQSGLQLVACWDSGRAHVLSGVLNFARLRRFQYRHHVPGRAGRDDLEHASLSCRIVEIGRASGRERG